jgi:hypothetical protein
VWSKSVERALAVANRLDTGTVWINKHLDLPPTVPYGGAKQSGFGVEQGQHGLEEFTRLRILNVAKQTHAAPRRCPRPRQSCHLCRRCGRPPACCQRLRPNRWRTAPVSR